MRKGIDNVSCDVGSCAARCGRWMRGATAGGLAIAAVIWHIASAMDVGLWVQPDSVGYVALSDWLLRYADFRHEMFAARTPGYPLLLAVIWHLSGGLMAWPILVVQHGLVLAAGILIGWLAWRLTRSNALVFLIAGMTALSWSLTAYANVLLTEVPFTVALLATLCCCVHYAQNGRAAALATGSACAAAAAMIRPVGLPLGLLPLAALWGSWLRRGPITEDRPDRGKPGFVRRAMISMALAMGPFLVVVSGWSWMVRSLHGVDGANNFGWYNLYLRLVTREGLTEPGSPALDDIRESVAWVNQCRRPEEALDYRTDIHAVMAYRQRHNCSWAEASSKLGEAAWVICKAHPWRVLVGTLRNAAHTLLKPDPVYLRRSPAQMEAWSRAGIAFPSTVEYEADFLTRVQPQVGPLHFRVRRTDAPISTAWTRLVWNFDRVFVRGPTPAWLPGDTWFETWVYFCLSGAGLMLLVDRRRIEWGLTLLAVGLPLAVSSFTPGEDPRFAVPLRPILHMWGTAAGAWAVRATRIAIQAATATRQPVTVH